MYVTSVTLSRLNSINTIDVTRADWCWLNVKCSMFQCSNVQMLKCSNVQISKCSNLQMFRCSDVQIRIYLNISEYIWIFEYLNILVTNIYSNIRSYQFFFYKHIWTFFRVKFVWTNLFGHSFVSIFLLQIYLDICSC